MLVNEKAALLAALARAVASADQELSLPSRLCVACAEILDVDGGAITLAYTGSERVTLCATDDNAARLEDLQDVLGQGPGPDAYVSGQPVLAKLDGDGPAGRWLMLTDAARSALGFAATVYAFPIRPDGAVVGVLSLYQVTARPISREISAVQFLADALGAALLHDHESHPGLAIQTDLAPGPWGSRARVHQATGIVVAQLRIKPDDALALLRARAFADDTTLDVIANQVVNRHLDFDTDERNGNENS